MSNLTPFWSFGLLGALSTGEIESERFPDKEKKAVYTKGYERKKAARKVSRKSRKRNRL